MTTELQTLLGQPEGARTLREWFAGVLRDGNIDDLDAFLQTELRAHPGDVSQLCLGIPADAVSITGWDGLYMDYLALERRSSRGQRITAIGIDLTAHSEPADDGWGLEASFYDDSAFSFSRENLDGINAVAAESSAPWQGCFLDLTHSLSVRGLSQLYAHLDAARHLFSRSSGQPVEVDAVAAELGWLFLTLRFHQALRAAIASQGLPQAMIVLGGAHDVPPYIEIAYWCETIASDLGAGAAMLARRDEERKAELRNHADETVADWRMRRDAIVKKEIRRDKRAEWIDYCTARDATLRSLYDLGEGPPVHLMDDHAFELLLHAVRCHYAARIGDEPPPAPQSAPRGRGLLGFFRS